MKDGVALITWKLLDNTGGLLIQDEDAEVGPQEGMGLAVRLGAWGGSPKEPGFLAWNLGMPRPVSRR